MDSTLECLNLRLDRFLESNHSTDDTREELKNIMSQIKTNTDQLDEIITAYRARVSDMYECAQSCTPDKQRLMEINMELADHLFARKKPIFIALDIHYERSKELIRELKRP